MIIARILQAPAPGGGEGKREREIGGEELLSLWLRGLAVGCAAVPVIYGTRKEARKIDDDQRRTAGIVPGRLFESCP
jgi:hypothetical protein